MEGENHDTAQSGSEVAGVPEGLPAKELESPPELGKLGGEAIVKYFNAAADYLMEVRAEIENYTTSLLAELKATADSAREIGRLEAQRTIDATVRMKKAVDSIQSVRNTLNGS